MQSTTDTTTDTSSSPKAIGQNIAKPNENLPYTALDNPFGGGFGGFASMASASPVAMEFSQLAGSPNKDQTSSSFFSEPVLESGASIDPLGPMSDSVFALGPSGAMKMEEAAKAIFSCWDESAPADDNRTNSPTIDTSDGDVRLPLGMRGRPSAPRIQAATVPLGGKLNQVWGAPNQPAFGRPLGAPAPAAIATQQQQQPVPLGANTNANLRNPLIQCTFFI